jgi:O-antigen/teichoic acid export membrane protein
VSLSGPLPPGAAVAAPLEPRPSRTEQTLSGWLWMSLGAGVQGLVTVAVLAVLARLLTPADFGSVSAGMLVINLSTLLSQGFVGPALVQHPRLRAEHVETGFSLSMLGAGVLFALLWVLAPAIAGVLHVPALVGVVRVLAWILPIQGLSAVADALLRRDLEFRAVAAIRMISFTFGYGVVGITVAALGGGLWALVAANGSQTVVNTVLLVRRRPEGMRFRMHRAELGEILAFTGGFSLGRIGNYAAVNGDYLVVVRWLGVAALGLYERAYQLMAAPATLVGQVLDDVLFPAIAQIQSEHQRVALAYRRCVAGVALLTLPLSAFVIVLAPEIVRVLLGERWSAVTAPLRVLVLGTLFRTSYKISDSLTRALGAVYRRAWRQWSYAALVIGGGVIGQRWGITGVAWVVLFALLANFLLTAHLGTRLVALSWPEYFDAHRPAFRTAAVVGVMAFAAATAARSLGIPPAGVLALTLAVTGSVLAVVWMSAADWLLGTDGQWLFARLWGFGASALRRVRPPRPAVGGVS